MEKHPIRTYTRKRVLEGKILEGAAKLCRLCLGKPEEPVPIFNQQSDFGVSLATRITVCVGLEVMQEDCLPDQICSECCSELNRCYRFRKKCEASYQRLKSHLKAVQEGASTEKTKTNSLILDSVREECIIAKSNNKSIKLEDGKTELEQKDRLSEFSKNNSDNISYILDNANIQENKECLVKVQQPFYTKDENKCATKQDIGTDRSSSRRVDEHLVNINSNQIMNSANSDMFVTSSNSSHLLQTSKSLLNMPAPATRIPFENLPFLTSSSALQSSSLQTPLISSFQTPTNSSHQNPPTSSNHDPTSYLQSLSSMLKNPPTSSFQPSLTSSILPSTSSLQTLTSISQPVTSSNQTLPSNYQSTPKSSYQSPLSLILQPSSSSGQISKISTAQSLPSCFRTVPSNLQPLKSTLPPPLSNCQPSQATSLQNPPTSSLPQPSNFQPSATKTFQNPHTSNQSSSSSSSVQTPPISISSLLTTVLLTVGAMHLQQPSGLLSWDGAVDELELNLGDGTQVFMVLEEEEPARCRKPVTAVQLQSTDPSSTTTLLNHEAAQPLAPALGSVSGPRQCSVCARTFASSSVRARHEREVHARCRPYACATCGRAFAQRCGLHRHQMLHEDSRPFRCECGRGFRQRGALKAHMVTHIGKPPLRPCPYDQCYKRFMYASGLSRHIKWHEGRKFVCADCGRVFLDKSALRRHIASDKHRRQIEMGDT